ncbi:UNVERIFIED_CONTAM: hypothetical protein Sindi_2492900 [Sesamum indicum]
MDDVHRRPRDMDGPTGAHVLGFRYFTQGTISFVRMRAHARLVGVGRRASFDPRLGHFDPGLGHFFGTRTKQGTRAGGSLRAVSGKRMRIGGGMEEGGRDESKQQRAESQQIVAARPLCRLQYPVAYLSRLQRILPAARWELYFKAASVARLPRWLGQRLGLNPVG